MNGPNPIYQTLRSSQISVRYGSQIHNTQTTILPQGTGLVQETPIKSMVPISSLQPSQVKSSFQFLGDMSTPEHMPAGSTPVRRSDIQQWITRSAIKDKRSPQPGRRNIINENRPLFMYQPPSTHSPGQDFQALQYPQGDDAVVGVKSTRIKYMNEPDHERQSNELVCPAEDVSDWNSNEAEVSSASRCSSRPIISEDEAKRRGRASKDKDPQIFKKPDTRDTRPQAAQLLHVAVMSPDQLFIPEAHLILERTSNTIDGVKYREMSVEQANQTNLTNSPAYQRLITKELEFPSNDGIINSHKAIAGMSKNESSPGQSLLQKQNEIWYNMIMGLDKAENHVRSLESNRDSKILLPHSSPFKLDQMKSPTPNWTPESMKSTCAQKGSTSSHEQFDRSNRDPIKLPDSMDSANQYGSMVTTRGSSIRIQEESPSVSKTPLKQSIHSPSWPTTPVKVSIGKPLGTEEINRVVLKPINLVPKFRFAAVAPVKLQPVGNSIKPIHGPGRTNTHRSRQTTTEQNKPKVANTSVPETRHLMVHAKMAQQLSPITFIRPQRFEELSPDSRIRIGQYPTKKQNKFMRRQGKSGCTEPLRLKDQPIESVEDALVVAVDNDDVEE